MEQTSALQFSALHVASGSTIDTNFLLVPAGQKYTIENVYLASETAGTMTALECPNNGLMIAHLKSTSGELTHQFSNLNAVVDATGGAVQCIYDRTGAGANEHTYIQIQYYPFDATAIHTPAEALNYSAAAALWLTFLILFAGAFYAVANFFRARFNKTTQ